MSDSINKYAKLIANIIDQIARYAKSNHMSVDNMIRDIGVELIVITDISTFERYKIDEETKDEL